MFATMNNKRGLTLIELVVTMVILGILASLVLPSARMTITRSKEIELRRNLRTIRTAIDEYKKTYDKAVEEGKIPKVVNKYGYPEDLKVLVEGYDFGGLVNYKRKFLRKIPEDPFNPVKEGEDPWGMRSSTDSIDSTTRGGDDVWDVFSLSDGTAIDGTKYKDW